MAEKPIESFHCMLRKNTFPQEFKDTPIIHLYKRKGNHLVCDDHRGISLLSIAGKLLTNIILNRLNVYLDQAGLTPESQYGFRKDKGAIDTKCQERNVKNEMWTST